MFAEDLHSLLTIMYGCHLSSHNRHDGDGDVSEQRKKETRMTKVMEYIDNETQGVENRRREGIGSTCGKHKSWNTNT